ncbi:Rrf2 family transcriptional regulator [Paenibacillus hemerocallicola]|uniref:Rrf2 family transcriptional regulator n=1 Tax=Paenibacillus hemerocallicola TaxID=1172614 RepID=A0A5C4T888_9BACL|nr:Rrf2 family transcriptional regulator [Paenibacillus hemerocallicola]TNJ64607.1 Rrf2 family transcriptional regulator [Paenibacillus hemerocallicola]
MNSEFTVAVHSLVFLAYLPEHMASSETIARNVSTNPTRIRKIMSFLREQGFVKTKEGVGGGYMLNCDPQKVTLAQIYRAMACGALKPNWNSGDPGQDCLVASNMQSVMDHIFREAEVQYRRCLEQTTICDVLEQVKHCQS